MTSNNPPFDRSPLSLQILAITTRIRKGVKNPGKAKAKISQIKQRQATAAWLAQ